MARFGGGGSRFGGFGGFGGGFRGGFGMRQSMQNWYANVMGNNVTNGPGGNASDYAAMKMGRSGQSATNSNKPKPDDMGAVANTLKDGKVEDVIKILKDMGFEHEDVGLDAIKTLEKADGQDKLKKILDETKMGDRTLRDILRNPTSAQEQRMAARIVIDMLGDAEGKGVDSKGVDVKKRLQEMKNTVEKAEISRKDFSKDFDQIITKLGNGFPANANDLAKFLEKHGDDSKWMKDAITTLNAADGSGQKKLDKILGETVVGHNKDGTNITMRDALHSDKIDKNTKIAMLKYAAAKSALEKDPNNQKLKNFANKLLNGIKANVEVAANKLPNKTDHIAMTGGEHLPDGTELPSPLGPGKGPNIEGPTLVT